MRWFGIAFVRVCGDLNGDLCLFVFSQGMLSFARPLRLVGNSEAAAVTFPC